MVELDALKPTAMLPAESIVVEANQRQSVSGEYVLSWNTAYVPLEIPRSSNQRTPAGVPALTEWLPTIDSWSPKLRYVRRNIRRSPRPSMELLPVPPSCGTQARLPGQSCVKAAAAGAPN